ncbi:PaaI family thioesterase [Salinisphaera sp. Q1T1-3]|uniref:PaaI family thioesterase n=1 Tax=Salinisphaera sp. Q1T1-3 TaxID=2321229 RepID=UPI000E76D9FC|nr:PaaI family thioesterase [Salinisphaera sp. Q1T1-3]RJS92489.1 PaaI family thioesterase [Salinisphaera sp. Q1T1-3]
MIESHHQIDPEAWARLAQRFHAAIPHSLAIGLTLVDAGPPSVHMRLPYRDVFLGDIDAGLWHTGIAAVAADATCGLAVFLTLSARSAIATLDLRMDHLRPAVAGSALDVVADCHHVTQRMAFVTAVLHQDDPTRPVARATATFARTGRLAPT